MPRVFVAAGSNVEPERHLAIAAAELRRTFPGTRFSPCYRNAAVGFTGADFLNLVAEFATDRPLDAVVAELQRIEGLCGRPRTAPKWAPRTMDLDLLLYGDLVSATPGLTLPRPDLLVRPYMLGPLADLAPELRHPVAGRTLGELWRECDRGAHRLQRCDLRELETPGP